MNCRDWTDLGPDEELASPAEKAARFFFPGNADRRVGFLKGAEWTQERFNAVRGDAAAQLIGVIDEYAAMPCQSLRERMISTANRYRMAK